MSMTNKRGQFEPLEARKARLKGCGKWAEFVARRQALRDEGKTEREANMIASEEFANFGNRPQEKSASVAAGFSERDFAHKPKISAVEGIRWAAAHLDAPAEQLTVENAPSADALSMVIQARSNDTQRQWFYQNFYSKLIPARNKLEQDGRQEDDGRSQLSILDAVAGDLEVVRCPHCGEVID